MFKNNVQNTDKKERCNMSSMSSEVLKKFKCSPEVLQKVYDMIETAEEPDFLVSISKAVGLSVNVVKKIYATTILNENIKKSPRYYVVGATWYQSDIPTVDMFDHFTKNSYWKMGWIKNAVPCFTERRNSMKIGDFIAIKKINGTNQIKIRSIGVIVGKVEVEGDEEDIIIVDWRYFPKERNVPLRGCMGTIHGPFYNDKTEEYYDWLLSVFFPE
jgi:hypothetical protein